MTVRIAGLSEIQSADTTITDDLVVTDALTVNGAVALGNAAADTIGFYGTTAISQRASSAQSTSLVISNSIGTAAEAVLEEICNTLTQLGLWKGGA